MNRGERLVRSISATSVAVLFAAMSHVLAGGPAPHLAAIGLTILVTLPVALWLAGKRLSLPRLLTLVLGSQALFHFAFVMVGHSAATTHAPLISAHAAHQAASSALVSSASTVAHDAGVGMWLAHIAAAIITVVALRFGEQGAVTLATFVRAALAGLRASVESAPILVAARPIRVTSSHTVPAQQTYLFGISRRGPPLG